VLETNNGCCPNVNVTGAETEDEWPGLAAFVAVTTHVTVPIEPNNEPLTEQPTPTTEKATAPVPEPPDVVRVILLPTVPVKVVFEISKGVTVGVGVTGGGGVTVGVGVTGGGGVGATVGVGARVAAAEGVGATVGRTVGGRVAFAEGVGVAIGATVGRTVGGRVAVADGVGVTEGLTVAVAEGVGTGVADVFV
jgi:hypothetical protein